MMPAFLLIKRELVNMQRRSNHHSDRLNIGSGSSHAVHPSRDFRKRKRLDNDGGSRNRLRDDNNEHSQKRRVVDDAPRAQLQNGGKKSGYFRLLMRHKNKFK